MLENPRKSGGFPFGGIMDWQKSSYSDGNTCVEVARDWRKSTYSNVNYSVEVQRREDGDVLLRDTEDPNVVVRIPARSWDAFLKGAHAGEFDEI
jgi:hypothetical protein